MDIPDCLNHLSEPRVLSRFHFFTNHSQDTCSIQALKSTPIENDPIQLYIFCNNRKNFLFQIQDKPGIDHFSKSIEFVSKKEGVLKLVNLGSEMGGHISTLLHFLGENMSKHSGFFPRIKKPKMHRHCRIGIF